MATTQEELDLAFQSVGAEVKKRVKSPNATVSGIEWYANEAALPAVGVAGVLYFVDT